MEPRLPFTTPPPRIVHQSLVGSLRPISRTEPAPAPATEHPEPPRHRPSRFRLSLFALAVAGAAFGAALLGRSTGHNRGLKHADVAIVSGRAPPKRSSTGAEERWQKSRVTVTIDDSIDALGPAARQAVESAFGAWLTSGARIPAFTFDSAHGTRVSEEPDGKNSVIYAAIDIPGHRNDLALTIAFTDPDTGAIVEADLVINSRHRFGVLGTESHASGHTANSDHESGSGLGRCGSPRVFECRGRYDPESVTMHEVGHFLGLGRDDTNTCAVMYRSTGRCEVNKRTLSSDDRTAMTELYAGGFADVPRAAGNCSPAPHPVNGPAPALVGLAIAIGAALRRRLAADC